MRCSEWFDKAIEAKRELDARREEYDEMWRERMAKVNATGLEQWEDFPDGSRLQILVRLTEVPLLEGGQRIEAVLRPYEARPRMPSVGERASALHEGITAASLERLLWFRVQIDNWIAGNRDHLPTASEYAAWCVQVDGKERAR